MYSNLLTSFVAIKCCSGVYQSILLAITLNIMRITPNRLSERQTNKDFQFFITWSKILGPPHQTVPRAPTMLSRALNQIPHFGAFPGLCHLQQTLYASNKIQYWEKDEIHKFLWSDIVYSFSEIGIQVQNKVHYIW